MRILTVLVACLLLSSFAYSQQKVRVYDESTKKTEIVDYKIAYEVDSVEQILGVTYPVGSKIVSKGLDGRGLANYIVESSVLSGAVVDTAYIIPLANGAYATYAEEKINMHNLLINATTRKERERNWRVMHNAADIAQLQKKTLDFSGVSYTVGIEFPVDVLSGTINTVDPTTVIHVDSVLNIIGSGQTIKAWPDTPERFVEARKLFEVQDGGHLNIDNVKWHGPTNWANGYQVYNVIVAPSGNTSRIEIKDTVDTWVSFYSNLSIGDTVAVDRDSTVSGE